MAKNVLMPQMGYDMDAGTLLRWLKNVGDSVERGEAIAEIETDKVNIEIEAFDSGVLAKTLIGEGDKVPVGEVIAVIAEPGEDVAESPPAAPSQPPAEAKPAAPSPTPVAPPAPQPALVTAQAPAATAVLERPANERVRSSPLVRRLAFENGIDLRQVPGSGPHGRIVKRDIEGILGGTVVLPGTPAQQPETQAPATPAAAPVTVEATPTSVPGPAGAQLQELPRIRQTIGKRMSQSMQEAPHFFVSISIDMTEALALRKTINAALDETSQVSVNDFVIKAAALTLRDFPVLNSTYVDGKMRVHDRIDVGMAVAIEGGLISPFIPNTDKLSLGEIARKTKDLARRAREGGLQPDEYAGGTFTTSNLGMFGVDNFSAIINPPQAAILGIAAAKVQPVWDEEAEEFKPRSLMTVTMSADHRLTDGVEVARYLKSLKEALEQPVRILAG
jgi:pyruvate dehydrogenase E2 component (dihydrolipoamide acetyltransferase)